MKFGLFIVNADGLKYFVCVDKKIDDNEYKIVHTNSDVDELPSSSRLVTVAVIDEIDDKENKEHEEHIKSKVGSCLRISGDSIIFY
jgi:regulatory protein YycH of two-component signal transduction system YycFG